MHYVKRWRLFCLILLMISCSGGDKGRNQKVQGPYSSDLYLIVTDGSGANTTWGPLATEDGRYYDVRPYFSANGVYEFLIQNQEQSLTFGYDRIRFDTEDKVVALKGTRNTEAFKLPLKGPGAYRFLFDTKDVARPFLTVTPSQVLSSVEYKLMLLPERFKSDSFAAVEQLRAELATLVEEKLGAGSLTTGAAGLPDEAGDRKTVYYFDTPQSCILKRSGLILRERKSASGSREFTLKVRGKDESEISQATIETQPGLTYESKLEEEISFAGNKDVYALKKSYSYSVDEIVTANQVIETIADFNSIFPGFYMNKDVPPLNPSNELRASFPAGLTEKVYVMGTVDLAGPNDSLAMLRKIELTVWFSSADSTIPIVSELSFKIKEPSGGISQDMRTRSDLLFAGMNNMEYWVSPNGITKTNFAYGYDPNFCH